MRQRLLGTLVLLAVAGPALAQKPTSFPDAKHGKGELTHVQGIPVLTVRGTPAEIGEQYGILAVKNAPDLDGLQARFFKDSGQKDGGWLARLMAKRLQPGVPGDHLAEMEAAVKASGRDLDLLLFANTVYDLSSSMGCSAVVLEKSRSTTGEPLFGRLFDWLPTKGIADHTLIVVMKPEGKRAFALVTITPIMGCISGMNDAGLCCTLNQVHLRLAKDKSVFNWDGVPTMLAFRRVLEECRTVAEAETLLRGIKRTTSANLTVCDKAGGAVFEMTPKSFEVRTAANGVTSCTNHFCCESLAGPGKPCKRLPKLLALRETDEKLGVSDVFEKLDAVNQGKYTLQAMVFEPVAKVLHLKLGDGTASATKSTAVRLDLGKLLANAERLRRE